MTTAPWQIQLQGAVDLRVRAPVVEVDGQTPARVIRALHRDGSRVLCYVDAGSWESFRPDAGAYPRSVLGRRYAGYPNERWLDVRRLDVLLPILRRRLDGCRRRGFDGADPDNMDGYRNRTGFPLTAADQLRFDRAVAGLAHRRGLAVTLKNDGGQVRALVGSFDGAVVESCLQYRECRPYTRWIRAGKPVFDIEYRGTLRSVCPAARRLRFSAILKRKELTAFRRPCRG